MSASTDGSGKVYVAGTTAGAFPGQTSEGPSGHLGSFVKHYKVKAVERRRQKLRYR